jgi:arylsulfatase A-like enzyme
MMKASSRCLALVTLMAVGLGGLRPAFAAEGSERRLNLVFILADDLGGRDTSVYGSTFHQTPNIDRLARSGIMFTNAYSANPLCSPTRCSIMTGLYPGRVGITTPSCHLPEERIEATLPQRGRPEERAIAPVSATRLNTTYPTLAKALRAAGYTTGHFGKWHLGLEPYSPLQHGFDVDVPHYSGASPAGSYLAPWKFPPALKFTGQPGEHIEDRMAAEAVRFIKANRDRPFYLNYWAFSVHGPWGGKKDLIDHYKSKAEPNAPQRNPVYAAMVHSLDDAVGTLMKTLDELNLTERTIVIFFSDNGGVHWFEARMKEELGMDSPPTSNLPLRGGKATLYEGGTREPCIVRWPGRVEAGGKSEALLSSVDFYPTILDMLGVERAEGQQLDGVSQVPALLGKGAPRQTAFCFFPHYTPATGNLPGVWVRQGEWKLIRFFCDNADQTDRFELYNLKEDLGETKNLADAQPGTVKELNTLIDQHLRDIKPVLPKPNPAYRPDATTTPADKAERRARRAARQAAGR